MTGTLFLTDTVTAYRSGDGDFRTAESLFGRRGKLRSNAHEILASFEEPGEVVACLPPFGTSCQTLRVRANIGREITHTDMSDAIEAALHRAGGGDLAVVCAEPSRILLDGEEVGASPVGRSAQLLEIEVAALVSELTFLAGIEKALEKGGFELKGVMAIEEAAAAAVAPGTPDKPPLVLVDRWHTKIVAFRNEGVAASSVIPVGAGHIHSDVAVTFTLADKDADILVDRILLSRTGEDEKDRLLVAQARLEEIASRTAEAGRTAGIVLDAGILLGIPATSKVQAVFAAEGLDLRSARLELKKTDPPVLALAEGAAMLTAGAVPRSAATALQLAAPKGDRSILGWIRRNF